MKNQVIIKKKIQPYNKKISVSGDKSLSIRCILISSIASGKSRIFNLLKSDDVLNSLKVIKQIGANYNITKNYIILDA